MKCRNGHEQPEAGANFCIYCGQPMIAVAQVPGPAPPQQQQGGTASMPPKVQLDPSSSARPPQPPIPPGHGQQVQQYPPVQQAYYGQAPVRAQPIVCGLCGGNPNNLPGKSVVCRECRLLKPLVPGYSVDNSAFAWAADAKAMAAANKKQAGESG